MEGMFSVSVLFGVAVATVFGYSLLLVLYRLYLHPLAKFPGPKLAAVTRWHEFYYQIICDGYFIWKIDEMHEQYGPIVRITPNELHIRDSQFFDEIYAPSAKKRDKFADFVIITGSLGATFATIGHAQHRLRRSALNPFFSKKSIISREPEIRAKVDKLCQRLEQCMKAGSILRLDVAYHAFTYDVITAFTYGQCDNVLDSDDFGLFWKEAIIAASRNGAFLRLFPWSLPILKATPVKLLDLLNPPAALLVRWQGKVLEHVMNVINLNRNGKRAENTIFQAILDSGLPPEEKTVQRLQDDAQNITAAGSETTAKVLAFVTFFLLDDKTKLSKLRQELSKVERDSNGEFSLLKLEQLPYLTACISEGIRMMYGIGTRSPRVAHEPLHYQNWIIPAGTPVGMSHVVVCDDPAIFPNPYSFDPDRWLRAADQGIHLERFLVSFSKGSRMCVGISLAYAELYLTLANVMSRFEMENYETTYQDDIRIRRDYFVGVPKPGSKGIRAKVVGLVGK